MKPMKNKAKSKNATGESASSIKNYFKNAPIGSNECGDEKECKTSGSKAVYVQALKDRLISYNGETKEEHIGNECDVIQNEVEADVIVDRINSEGAGVVVESGIVDYGINETAATLDDLKSSKLCDPAIELWRQKYKDLKQTHMKLCLQHCELSVKYNELVKTLDAVKLAKSSSDVGNSTTSYADVLSPTDNIFTESQIRVLESIPLEKKKDSTFILQCIEYAYKDTAASLVNKTLKGTLERKEFREDGAVVVRPAKDSLTPEKVTRIEQLFITRVTKSRCLSGEFSERIKASNINRHIASAIGNVSSKYKPKSSSSKKNENLNL